MENGLHDGLVRCIGQDKYGYIWIGNVGALSRFDGKNVKHFTHIPGDSTSPYGSQPRSIHTDKKGRLWIGMETGLMEYVFSTASFLKIPVFKNLFINKIVSIDDSILFVGTRQGLIRYNSITGTTFKYFESDQPGFAQLKKTPVHDIYVKGDSILMTTNKGLVFMNHRTEKIIPASLPQILNIPIYTISVDNDHNIWLGIHGKIKLVKVHADLKRVDIYDQYLSADYNTQPLNVMDILTDSKGRVWVVTAVDGLLLYEKNSNGFIKYLHNKYIYSSPSGNSYRCIFQDDTGFIWLGCDFNGVNYFNPEKNLFKTILPFPDRLDERSRNVSRAVTEDKEGNIWMGTHDGVSKLDARTNTYTVWRNDENKKPVIYSNVVRSILCDDDNNIWIGTANGVNRYNNRTKQMEFISDKELPHSFYNSINKDRSGNIWFCTNDSNSLYWYSTSAKQYENISNHPALKKFKGYTPTSYVLEDSKNRLWISLSRRGVTMYDKKSGELKHYMVSDSNTGRSIIGNQVIDIKEDKKGIIWISSFNGISGIDVENDTVLSFNNRNGLAGNWASSIAVDSLDRIWVGVNGAMVMINKNRDQLTSFNMNDGLPSVGFPEHAAITTANGDIIFPSNNGFIRFNPLEFREEKTDLKFYFAGYSVFDKMFYDKNDHDDDTKLNFGAKENSFSFNMVALNYHNTDETWFAYKLEGFDKDWHYTKDAKAVYTNIPGGNYLFLYKAALNNANWDLVEAKQINIKLKTIFYKTTWFWILLVFIFTSLLYALYQYRLRKQKEVYQLKSKAQLLEKEKAMVMYEGLKQQLNPHFLFNSLTSLNSLISTDPKTANSFLDSLSKTYRYILKSRDNESVPLSEELKFAENYVKLQQTRFEKGFEVDINVPEAYQHRKIVPVTLQNLVENAIKHNVIDEEKPLVVNIFVEDEKLVVQNNLQLKSFVETSNKQGLSNLQSLYHYLTDQPVEIRSGENFFTVKIPLL